MNTVVNISAKPRPRVLRKSQAAVDPVAQVVRETVAVALEYFGLRLQAIILTGSAARGEATIVKVPGGWDFLGDCEFALMFKPGEKLARPYQVMQVQGEIARRLQRVGIACPLGLSPVHPRYLANLGPKIYSFELKQCGRVVWGDPGILALIPGCSARDIPREDAWRLVCNRMIEQLTAASEAPPRAPRLPSQFNYQTTKLALDLATSFLIFRGEYAPSYQERSARLLKLAEATPPMPTLPFALRPFADLVHRLTCWKICPAREEPEIPASLGPTVWDYAGRLWNWELLQLIDEPRGPSRSSPVHRWMQLQPLNQRLRGWASLARRCGFWEGFRHWPHWARLGRQASPRYWIYAAAGELFLQLPRLTEDAERAVPNHSLETWRDWLPLRPREESRPGISWRQLAREINWNYQQFLMGTIS